MRSKRAELKRGSVTIACLCLVFLVGFVTVGYAQNEGVEKLIRDLNDESKDVRSKAAKALGKIGDTKAVEPLIALLKDKSRGFYLGVKFHATKRRRSILF